VRRHNRAGRLRQRSDLAELGEAARMGQIGLQHGGAGFERIAERPLAHPALARGDRNGRRVDDPPEQIDPLGRKRLFDEQRAIRHEPFDQLLRPAHVRVMDIHRDVDVLADSRPDGRDALLDLIQIRRPVERIRRAEMQL